MSTANRVIKNTFFLYIKTFVSMFVMLYTTRIVLNTLGTTDFGIYDVVAGAIAMLGFFNMSMANTVQRYLNNAQAQNNLELQKSVFNVGVVFHFFIALFILLALFLFSFFYSLAHSLLLSQFLMMHP